VAGIGEHGTGAGLHLDSDDPAVLKLGYDIHLVPAVGVLAWNSAGEKARHAVSAQLGGNHERVEQ
jgi:hypothetical protein